MRKTSVSMRSLFSKVYSFRLIYKKHLSTKHALNNLKNNTARYWKDYSQDIFGKRRLITWLTLTISGAAYYRYIHSDLFSLHHVSAKEPGLKDIKISRMVKNDKDSSGLMLTLFQYQTCPFCCKVRALLDYRGYSYNIIEVNSIWRKEIKWSKYKKVPILVCERTTEDDYLQINDSSVIISVMESHIIDQSQKIEKLLSYFPVIESKNEKGKTVYDYPNKYFIMFGEEPAYGTPDYMKKERKWRAWVDDILVHTLSPNIYRTPSEALQAFNYFSQVGEWEKNFTIFDRLVVIYIGAAAMYFVGKILKKRYNLSDDVRSSLYEACKEWMKALESQPFMGGEKPNLADLSAYGVLSSIEGCNAFRDLLEHTKIGSWYYQVKKAVQTHQGAQISI